MDSTTAPPSSASSPDKPVTLPIRFLELVGRLRDQKERAAATRELARSLGADDLVLFSRDRELGVLLPALGFPQTLPRGRDWPAFLARCVELGRHESELPALSGAPERVRVTGCAAGDEALVVLIGGAATGDELSALCLLLPLISGAVQGEMAEVRAAGHAATARHVAEQAEGLAQALDVARRNLEGALREARDADRRKNEFLAMLGHELRNPLAPVLSALEVMRSLGTSDPALSRAREVIERQVHSLTRLVDDLLDVSRITRGKIELRKASVELVQVIRHAVETSQPLIQSRDHHLTLELPDEPLWLSADAARLEQILANLLNNAAKYTPDGGEICVIAKRVGGLAEVRIRDNGIGIPRELLPSIFEIFVQQERSLDRAQGGLGLGLALVKNLVQMHGGDVEARSEGRGRGSEFIVRLPMLPAVPELDAMPLETLHRPKSPLRVLVVDDNRDAAVTMGDLLELWDHEVSLAFDGLTALERARELAPDVVLLDIGLPGMDGYEVARRLRSEGYSEMLLIALTGYGQEEDRRRALEVGFDQHMTKPVDPDALKSALRSRGCNLRSSGPEG